MTKKSKATTTTEPQVEEVDLIRIKTIKRKHAEALLLEPPTSPQDGPEDYEAAYLFLAYLTGLDAILARSKATQHLTAIRAIHYYNQAIGNAPRDSWREAREMAYEKVHRLPQIIID